MKAVELAAMNGIPKDLAVRSSVPENESVVERVSAQMQVMERMPLHKAALAARMNYTHFSLIRKLLMLKVREDVSSDERAVIMSALDMIDGQRRFAEAFTLVSAVIAKHWYPQSRDGRGVTADKKKYRHEYHQRTRPKRDRIRAERRAQKRLDRTLFAIKEACTNNEEMKIPKLDAASRQGAVDIIDDAIGGLFELKRKIKEETANEGP